MVCFCRLRNTIDDRTGLGSGYRIDHHPILFPDAEATDRTFCGIVIHRHFSIIQKYLQVFLLIQTVREALPCLTFMGDAADVFFHPREKGFHQGADA